MNKIVLILLQKFFCVVYCVFGFLKFVYDKVSRLWNWSNNKAFPAMHEFFIQILTLVSFLILLVVILFSSGMITNNYEGFLPIMQTIMITLATLLGFSFIVMSKLFTDTAKISRKQKEEATDFVFMTEWFIISLVCAILFVLFTQLDNEFVLDLDIYGGITLYLTKNLFVYLSVLFTQISILVGLKTLYGLLHKIAKRYKI